MKLSQPSVLAFDSNCLSGRVAVVTGANGGLGKSIVHRLSGMGATMVLLDLEPSRSAKGIRNSLSLACDISDPESVALTAQTVLDRFGRCDILVNNAGIKTPPVPLEELPVDDWDRVFAVNVRGAFLCAKAFAPAMIAQGGASIVNIASIGARTPTRVGPYGPSKAALSGLTRQMAVEWGPHGIRANSVSPGLVRTPMSDGYYRDEKAVAARLRSLALRRFGEPMDIADAVAFLASDASMFITGQDLMVDGGMLPSQLYNLQTQPGSS